MKGFFKHASIFVFSSLFCASALQAQEQWYNETLYPEWGQRIRMDEVIYEEKTELQDLVIFENARFGRVLALDGVIQLTEADEYVYHEMLAHVPLLAHGNARRVLIIGGGDGGMLREVLRHPTVETVVQVEIDPSVIELSKKWIPNVSRGSFDDPRLQLIIADGAKFVHETDQRFDVIICDSTDPIGPGEVLFTSEFYGNCKRVLNPKGIFVNQNGVPFLQGFEVTDTYNNRKDHFAVTTFYLAPVPTYAGGFMAFGWATDCEDYADVSQKVLQKRLSKIDGKMKYYTPKIHQASFALPPFIQEHIPGKGN